MSWAGGRGGRGGAAGAIPPIGVVWPREVIQGQMGAHLTAAQQAMAHALAKGNVAALAQATGAAGGMPPPLPLVSRLLLLCVRGVVLASCADMS